MLAGRTSERKPLNLIGPEPGCLVPLCDITRQRHDNARHPSGNTAIGGSAQRTERALWLEPQDGCEVEEASLRPLCAHGENGEFHTFVFDGPIFNEPVRFLPGEVTRRDSFLFCDLLPET